LGTSWYRYRYGPVTLVTAVLRPVPNGKKNADSDMAGDANDRKSTSDIHYLLGGNPMAW
jgi:hypothetical protein